jgi:hypothetical protein
VCGHRQSEKSKPTARNIYHYAGDSLIPAACMEIHKYNKAKSVERNRRRSSNRTLQLPLIARFCKFIPFMDKRFNVALSLLMKSLSRFRVLNSTTSHQFLFSPNAIPIRRRHHSLLSFNAQPREQVVLLRIGKYKHTNKST